MVYLLGDFLSHDIEFRFQQELLSNEYTVDRVPLPFTPINELDHGQGQRRADDLHLEKGGSFFVRFRSVCFLVRLSPSRGDSVEEKRNGPQVDNATVFFNASPGK